MNKLPLSLQVGAKLIEVGVFFLFILTQRAEATSYLYYASFDDSTTNQIHQYALTGPSAGTDTTIYQNVTTNGTSNYGTYGIAVDPVNSKVYWTEVTYANSTVTTSIKRADLNGNNVQTFYSATSGQPSSVAIDPYHNQVYWAESNVVKSAHLDGTNIQNIPNTSFTGQAYAVALDLTNNKLYWGSPNQTSGPNIFRSNLDGSSMETIDSKAYSTFSLAVDPIGQKLYWTQVNAYNNPEEYEKVFRANFSDFPITSSAADQYPTGNKEQLLMNINEAGGVSVDHYGGKIYVAAGGAHKIVQANLDGSGAVNFINTGSSYYSYTSALLLDNTPVLASGNNIFLGNGVYVNFSSILSDGMTNAVADAGAASSFGMQMLPGSIVDLSSNASLSGLYNLTLPYDPSQLPAGITENMLNIAHKSLSGLIWGLNPFVDTVNHAVTATFDSAAGFSPFGVGVSTPEPATFLLMGAGLLGLLPRLRKFLVR